MSKKIELKVQIFCGKCKTTIWTTAAKIHGVNSLSLDEDKGVLTVIGSADAVEIVEKLRKAKICAEILSLGPEKKEEKKDEKKDEKKIECVPICYCNYKPCHCYYGASYKPTAYGLPQVIYSEQYPDNNCTIC